MDIDSKIYVAGHTGLVGSAIVKSLKAKRYTNIIGKTFEELDLKNAASVKSFFELEKPEYVFLAAAKVGGIIANNTYRADFIYENLMIQNNVIHQSYLSGVKKLLFLGSTCIYPKECPQPMKEEYLLTSTLEYTNEPYAIAKIAGIKMCESYNIQYGTNFIAVMPTNLYGPNDNFDLEKSHVLPALIRKIHLGKCLEENNWKAIRADLNKRPITGVNGENLEEEILCELKKYGIILNDIEESLKHYSQSQGTSKRPVSVEVWGSGEPMREFLWSEEMADACVFLMENVNFVDVIMNGEKRNEESQTIEVRNTHINIGSGKEISIKNLATLVKNIIGFKGELFFNNEKPNGTLRKMTDVNKLLKLGWKHKINIEEGVQRLYEWYFHN